MRWSVKALSTEPVTQHILSIRYLYSIWGSSLETQGRLSFQGLQVWVSNQTSFMRSKQVLATAALLLIQVNYLYFIEKYLSPADMAQWLSNDL